jgi:hypothetical protein
MQVLGEVPAGAPSVKNRRMMLTVTERLRDLSDYLAAVRRSGAEGGLGLNISMAGVLLGRVTARAPKTFSAYVESWVEREIVRMNGDKPLSQEVRGAFAGQVALGAGMGDYESYWTGVRRKGPSRTGRMNGFHERFGIDSRAVALIPLPAGMLAKADLPKLLKNVLSVHGKAIFFVEEGAKGVEAFEEIIRSTGKGEKISLERIPKGQLFSGNDLLMAAMEGDPHQVPYVQAYCPDGYNPIDRDVKDRTRLNRESARPLGLLFFFERMRQLAAFIDSQA